MHFLRVPRFKTYLLAALPLLLLAILVQRWSWLPRYVMKGDAIVRALAFSPDGNTLAVALYTPIAQVVLRDLERETNLITRQFSCWAISSVCFSPDGKAVAITTTRPYEVLRWDAASGKLLARNSLQRELPACILNDSTADRLTTVAAHRIDTWDRKTLARLSSQGTRYRPVETSAYSPYGKTVTSCYNIMTRDSISVTKDRGSQVHKWKRTAGTALTINDSSASAMAFSPDGSTLAIGSLSGELILWDTATFTRERVIQTGNQAITALAFDADGARLASGSIDGTVQLWRVR